MPKEGCLHFWCTPQGLEGNCEHCARSEVIIALRVVTYDLTLLDSVRAGSLQRVPEAHVPVSYHREHRETMSDKCPYRAIGDVRSVFFRVVYEIVQPPNDAFGGR